MDQNTQEWLDINRKAYLETRDKPMEERRYQEFINVHVGEPLKCDRRGDGLWGHCNGRWFKLSAFPQAVPMGFAITPDHIQDRESCGTFGRNGIESTASELIRYAREKGDWVEFTAEEVKISTDGLDYLAEVGFLLKEGTTYHYAMGLVFEFYSAYPSDGAKQVIDEISRQRMEFFKECISMQTILKITFKDETDKDPSYKPEVVYCLFKSHVRAKFVTVVKDGRETTYNLLDIGSVQKA